VFVELLPGVDGLLHTSEIPRHRQGELRGAAGGGAEITVMILNVDLEKHRIALALAPDDAVPGAQIESTVAVGAVLTGMVERVETFGVFVRLGPGQTGLVPNAELGTTRGSDHRKAFPVGGELKVLVLEIDDNGRRIRLSHAQAVAHEERAESQAYLDTAAKKGGGFGMTLAEKFREARRR
jgi:small subunit ribosomal protein S1